MRRTDRIGSERARNAAVEEMNFLYRAPGRGPYAKIGTDLLFNITKATLKLKKTYKKET